MTIQLSDHQEKLLREVLHEAVGIARIYRENVADEDSIILAQNLRVVCRLLGLPEVEEEGELHEGVRG